MEQQLLTHIHISYLVPSPERHIVVHISISCSIFPSDRIGSVRPVSYRGTEAGLPAPRGLAASAAVVDGKLWLMGGSPTYTAGDSVFVYDIASDSWAVGPALPRPVA